MHSGIYAAQHEGFYRDEGVDLTIRQPGESTDAPKLLAAGRADFAILDIHDLGIARERGIDLVGTMPLVQRPLAAVIARGDRGIARPRDLEGRTVGVTGLPSDEAVVDSEVSADGGNPARVKRVTIGFNAISSLAAGKVDAATGFWNAEGVALRRQGVPIRIFKVDRLRRPALPRARPRRLAADHPSSDPELVDSVLAATTRGYELTVRDPERALDDLLAEVPSLDRAEQRAQLDALLPDLRPAPLRSRRPARLGAVGSRARPARTAPRCGRGVRARLAAVSLAADFQQVLDAMPPDWTDLELDLRIEDESRYVDAAVALSQVNAQPYSQADWDWRLIVAHSFGHAAAAETVKGVLAKLDADGIGGEMQLREVREGRAEVVQMWGRPESVREEFRERRSL